MARQWRHTAGGQEPDEATLKVLIRKGTIGGAFVPVLCGSAFENKGVQPLLDAVVSYLPRRWMCPMKGFDVDDAENFWSGNPATASRSRGLRSRS